MFSFKKNEWTTPEGDDFLCGPVFYISHSQEGVWYYNYESDEERALSVTEGILVVYWVLLMIKPWECK